MPAGFLYILSNPTIPGLCKVGKTTRDPSLRANELSGATGVASPFVLLYQQPVAYADAAEIWVHRAMDARGWRHAGNREFFTAPLHEIVALVLQAADIAQPATDSLQNVADDGDLDDWTHFLNEGQKLHVLGMDILHGSGGTLADPKRGLALICQAADMGDVLACSFAGGVLLRGDAGIGKDLPRAYRYLRSAIEGGMVACHALLAQLFHENRQPVDARKHWETYFALTADRLRNLSNDDQGWIDAARSAGEHGCEYLDLVSRAVIEDTVEVDQFSALAPFIDHAIQQKRESFSERRLAPDVKRILERDLERLLDVLERKSLPDR